MPSPRKINDNEMHLKKTKKNMSEPEKNKEAVGTTEDWAILPFDEEEDDARWSKLIEDTDKLIAEAEEMEAVQGDILTENKLSDLKTAEEETEDELF